MTAAAASRANPIAWLIAPALLLFVLFFVIPFGVMAVMSFFSGNPISNGNADKARGTIRITRHVHDPGERLGDVIIASEM